MPHPESLLGTLFGKPHNAALIMLLTDTYVVGDVAHEFVHNGTIRRDLEYEFYCTGAIVQARTFVAWLSKEGVRLDVVPEDDNRVIGTVTVGASVYRIRVRFTFGVNIVQCALGLCGESMSVQCYMSGTDCVALLHNEVDHEDTSIGLMERLAIEDCSREHYENMVSEAGGCVSYIYSKKRLIRTEYYRMSTWESNTVLQRYISHLRGARAHATLEIDDDDEPVTNITVLSMDDDITMQFHATRMSADPIGLVVGQLAQMAVGLGVVSLGSGSSEKVLESKLAHNSRSIYMACTPGPGERTIHRWPQVRDDIDRWVAGLQEMAYGITEVFAMGLDSYAESPVPI